MAVSNALRTSGAYESLIQSILTYESGPKLAIQAARAQQDQYKSVLGNLDSKLSALHTLAKSFNDIFSNPFAARSTVVPDGSPFSISTTGSASYGSHSVFVDRLASTDQRVSKQLSKDGDDLKKVFDRQSEQTFTLSVSSPTSEDPENRVDVDVVVNATGTTNAEVLAEVDAAIAGALDTAVSEGLIRTSDRPAVSTASETSDTTRLSMRAGGTGFQNRIIMTDTSRARGGDTLLSVLEINSENVVGAGTSGGMIVDVGTTETDSELNSLLEVDGLLLYRSGNQISDAIPGLTISLEGVSEFNTEFIVDADTDSIVERLEEFVEKYNDSIKTIADQSIIDGDTGVRGPLANDSTISGLRFNLRSAVSRGVTGQTLGAPGFLGDLGLTINNDGTLEISDKEKLSEAVKTDASAVQSFFAGEDGLTTRLETMLDSIVGTTGLLDSRDDSIAERIKQLTSRETAFDERMSRREGQLRAEYARLEEALSLFQSQQQYVSAIFA